MLLSILAIALRPLAPSDAIWEMSQVAASLARGHGFGSPFGGATGPTAFVPPLYPWLLAAIFRVFGIQTQASVIAAQIFDGVCHSGTAVLLYFLGKQVFDERIARWASMAWAVAGPVTYLLSFSFLLPASGYWCFDIWVTALTTTLLVLVLLLTCRTEHWTGDRRWFGFGVVFGIASLANPAILAILPPTAYWTIRQRRRGAMPWVRQWGMVGLGLVLIVSPWIARNFERFHHLVFIRSNFWLEVELVNNPANTGTWAAAMHPDTNPEEFRKYATFGEVAYMAEKRAEAIAFVCGNPEKFALLTLRRMAYVWLGEPISSKLLGKAAQLKRLPFALYSCLALLGLWLANRHRNRFAVLFAGTIVFYPLVYYFTNSSAMYRYPISPVLMLLAAYAVHAFATGEHRHPGHSQSVEQAGQRRNTPLARGA